MSPTGNEIRATISFAGASGMLVPERIRTLAARIEGHSTAVAVVGMQNRGKSTLFNRLVGAEVSAVAATPETACTLRVKKGFPQASGRTSSGKLITLPPEPVDFRERLRRNTKPVIRSAEISGNFRLPEGLVLIDTPGVGEAVTSMDEVLAGLDEQWIDAGAGAALVVLSQVTDSKDRALIEKANEAFPGAVSVVIKATSRDVDPSEIFEWSDYLRVEFGIDALPIMDSIPITPWGTDSEFAELERLISDLERRAAMRLEGDLQRYKAFVSELSSELKSAQLVDLPTLREQSRLPNLPSEIDHELRSAVTRLTELQESESDALTKMERERRRKDAEKRTESLIGLFEMEGTGWPEKFSLLDQLAAASSQGSLSAAKYLKSIISKVAIYPSAQGDRLKFFMAVIAGIPEDQRNAAIASCPLQFDEIVRLLRSTDSAASRDDLEQLAMKRVGRNASNLAALRSVVRNSERQKTLLDWEREELAKEQTAAIKTQIDAIPTTWNESNLGSVASRLKSSKDAIELSLMLASEIETHKRAEFREASESRIERAWEEAAFLSLKSLRNWFEKYPVSPDQHRKSLDKLLADTRLIAQKRSGTATGARVARFRSAAVSAGPEWLTDVLAAEEVGRKSARLRNVFFRRAITTSIVLMILMAMLCSTHPAFALVSLAAFVVLIILSSLDTSDLAWQDLAPQVEFPRIILALADDAPRRCRLPARENRSPTVTARTVYFLGIVTAVIASMGSIAYLLDSSASQSRSSSNSSSSFASARTTSRPSPTSTFRPSTTSTIAPTTTTSLRSTSTTSSSTTSIRPSTSTTIGRNSLTELRSDLAVEPQKCGANLGQPRAYPHSSTRTYEVTATIGIWNWPNVSSDLIGIIPVRSYGEGGLGCPDGAAPFVKVTCKTSGQTITSPFGRDSTWLWVSIDRYQGYVTDHYVDTRWDISSIPTC